VRDPARTIPRAIYRRWLSPLTVYTDMAIGILAGFGADRLPTCRRRLPPQSP
jgi:hypothetical protein